MKYSVAICLLTASVLLNAEVFCYAEMPCPEKKNPVPIYTYKIINIYPHDRSAFTQGLVFENGFLYEGTGIYGQSALRKMALDTGEVLQTHRLPDRFFGEGITVYDNQIIQLTWKSKTGFVYDKDSFRLLKTFEYPTEGWGITHDGRQLIMSDGTAALHFLNPQTFKETDRIEVSDPGGPVTRLNELEFIRGEIYANVWQTDCIAKIDPATGRVTGWIILKGLLNFQDYAQPVDVLNGIAYNAETDRMFVTGKLWPKLFEIKIIGN